MRMLVLAVAGAAAALVSLTGCASNTGTPAHHANPCTGIGVSVGCTGSGGETPPATSTHRHDCPVGIGICVGQSGQGSGGIIGNAPKPNTPGVSAPAAAQTHPVVYCTATKTGSQCTIWSAAATIVHLPASVTDADRYTFAARTEQCGYTGQPQCHAPRQALAAPSLKATAPLSPAAGQRYWAGSTGVTYGASLRVPGGRQPISVPAHSRVTVAIRTNGTGR